MVIDNKVLISVSNAGYMPPTNDDPGDRHGFLGRLELDDELIGVLKGIEINATPFDVSPGEFNVQSASDKDLIPCGYED